MEPNHLVMLCIGFSSTTDWEKRERTFEEEPKVDVSISKIDAMVVVEWNGRQRELVVGLHMRVGV